MLLKPSQISIEVLYLLFNACVYKKRFYYILVVSPKQWGNYSEKRPWKVSNRCRVAGQMRRKSKKDRQYNGQKKRDKMTNNVRQNITQKTRDWATKTPPFIVAYTLFIYPNLLEYNVQGYIRIWPATLHRLLTFHGLFSE
jgi:hypothetical protein